MSIETKYIGGNVVEVKQEDRNGVPVGIVEGYIATWDIDRGDFFGVKDQFKRGAFLESINDHKSRGRQIRLKDHHGRTIGGFPIENVHEDERGLFGIGEINLEVQQGREAFSLAKQKVLTDFSIGFSVEESSLDEQRELRTISKAVVWEGSIVDEPMNPHANIMAVKSVVPFQDLPLADRDRAWDSATAIQRVRGFTDSEEEPSSSYRRAFVWFDRETSDTFGAYKLPIADVINGQLTAIPRAIFAAAAALQGARGGVDIPDTDRARVISHIERYYAKMDLESPFSDDDKSFYTLADVKDWSVRDIEKFLKSTECMSNSAAKLLAGRIAITKDSQDIDKDLNSNYNDVVAELKSITNGLIKANQTN